MTATGFEADFEAAEVIPSPNRGERAAGKTVNALILHYTGMESAEGACRWLCDPRVSCLPG